MTVRLAVRRGDTNDTNSAFPRLAGCVSCLQRKRTNDGGQERVLAQGDHEESHRPKGKVPPFRRGFARHGTIDPMSDCCVFLKAKVVEPPYSAKGSGTGNCSGPAMGILCAGRRLTPSAKRRFTPLRFQPSRYTHDLRGTGTAYDHGENTPLASTRVQCAKVRFEPG